MKVLVTSFDPFGGEVVNPASIVAERLPNRIGDIDIYKLVIPTVFYKSISKIEKHIDKIKPDYVLSIGQAGGRSRISVERIGINVDDARIPDNKGQSPKDKAIAAKGPAAYFATIPIKQMVKMMIEKNIPSEISNTAGTYVCNHVLYGVLHYIKKKKLPIKAGFIHIPYVMEQVIDKSATPSMSVESLVEGLQFAIMAMVDPSLADENVNIDSKTC